MKPMKKYRWLLLLLAVSFFVTTCMTIEEVIHPAEAKVDSDINILVKIKIVAETDGNSELAFGILVPKSWDVANNAILTLTTNAKDNVNVVNDEHMELVEANDKNPSDGLPWASSFQSKIGILDNTGPVEWVVFKSSTIFQIDDTNPNRKEVNGIVTIKLHTGLKAIKFYMGYTFCGAAYGFDDEKYPDDYVKFAKILEVTGGEDPMLDYTIDPVMSFIPATFSFGDIFSIRYNEPNYVTDGLKGSDVYLVGKVVYEENGVEKEKIVEEKNSKTLMESLGDLGQVTSFQKYIYPKDFFDLPKDAIILRMRLHFTNKEGSIVIMDNETNEDFVVEETCE